MDFCTRQLNVDLLAASETSVVQRLTVQVWDTAGQEQFHSLTATYYRKVCAHSPLSRLHSALRLLEPPFTLLLAPARVGFALCRRAAL